MKENTSIHKDEEPITRGSASDSPTAECLSHESLYDVTNNEDKSQRGVDSTKNDISVEKTVVVKAIIDNKDSVRAEDVVIEELQRILTAV